MSNFTGMNVESGGKTSVSFQSRLPAQIRESAHVGQRRVGQCESRSTRNGTGHVRNTVMYDTVHNECWIGVGRRSAGLEAAALVDGDINQNRTTLHGGEHSACYELRGRGSCNEHSTDYEIRFAHQALDRFGC